MKDGLAVRVFAGGLSYEQDWFLPLVAETDLYRAAQAAGHVDREHSFKAGEKSRVVIWANMFGSMGVLSKAQR